VGVSSGGAAASPHESPGESPGESPVLRAISDTAIDFFGLPSELFS
jgi:hypothetical protein